MMQQHLVLNSQHHHNHAYSFYFLFGLIIEWEPFNKDFLQLQIMSETDLAGGNKDGIYLMFITSIRNPINRLLSAYKFWGQLNNPDEVKPSLELFLQRRNRQANRWRVLSGNFAGNVARFNFATWKFSGGMLPVGKLEMDAEKNLSPAGAKRLLAAGTAAVTLEEEVWRQPFEAAIKALAKFDLIIPMELLSDHPEPLRNLLGWENFEKSHVVNMGKVVNNDASSELSSEVFDVLWDVNKLDIVIYHWISAVYLARLNCADILS